MVHRSKVLFQVRIVQQENWIISHLEGLCDIIKVYLKRTTLNRAFRWTQQLDGLYPLRYFFWMWHCQHALVNVVHIPSHAIRVQHV
jgi:hypothetical protein